MKTRFLQLALLACGLAAGVSTSFSAQAQTTSQPPETPADAPTRTLDVAAFDGLDVQVLAVVEVSEGNVQKVEVTGPDDLLSQLKAEVENGTLRFFFERRQPHLHRKRSLRIAITAPALRRLKITGAGDLTSRTPLTAPALAITLTGAGNAALTVHNERTRVTISGAGNVTLTGTTTAQDVHISGAGNYRGYELQSADADVSITGTGNQELSASHSLSAAISGLGNIRYRGQPGRVQRQISGLGKIESVN